MTIKQLKDAMLDKFDALIASYGENTDLSNNQDGINEVSKGVDEVNETWNPNLPKRPGSN